MSTTEINQITSDLAEIYGVDRSEIETSVDYVTSGTLNITIPEGFADVEVIDLLQASISDVLGIHSSDVVVTIDDEGVVTYSASGNTFTEVSVLQQIADQDNFANLVSVDLLESGSDIFVEATSSNEDIEVVVLATVDTTDAIGTVDRDVAIIKLTQDHNFTNSIIEGNISCNCCHHPAGKKDPLKTIIDEL